MSNNLRKESAKAAVGKTARAASTTTTKKASEAAPKTAACKARATSPVAAAGSKTAARKTVVKAVPELAPKTAKTTAKTTAKAVTTAVAKPTAKTPAAKPTARKAATAAETSITPAKKARVVKTTPGSLQPAKATVVPRKHTRVPASVAAAAPADKSELPLVAVAAAVTAEGESNAPVVATAKAPTVPSSVSAPKVAIEGAPAPGFQLPRDGGGLVSLTDYAGQNLVIYFYPRAGTPGCTKEAIEFTRLSRAFAETNTAVLGVSADPIKAQETFRNKYNLTTPLMSDTAHAMLKAYGAWGEKSMYGRTFEGVLRTTVLIGPDGVISRIWRNVKVDGHADVVLGAAGQF